MKSSVSVYRNATPCAALAVPWESGKSAAVIRSRFYVLAVVGILNSTISLYYYMAPVRMMFLEEPHGDETPLTFEPWTYGLMGMLACATIALGLYWTPIIAFADRSMHFFTGPS